MLRVETSEKSVLRVGQQVLSRAVLFFMFLRKGMEREDYLVVCLVDVVIDDS